MARGGRTRLIGRGAELEVVRRFVADLSAGPASLVIHGEPGIGKTALWRAALDEAQGVTAARVLRAAAEAQVIVGRLP